MTPTPYTGRRKWIAFSVLCLSLAIAMIDDTVLSIAVPALYDQLGASNSQVQWAMASYIMSYSILLLPAGNLSDRYGRRTFLAIGLIIFTIGSALAAFSPTPTVLIVFRIIQGIGGALILPTTLSILIEVFPSEERTKAIALWTTVAGLAIVVGPTISGWLLGHFWWGSIFFVNIPLAIIAIAGVWQLPNHRNPAVSPIDPGGILLSSLAIAGILFAVIQAPAWGITNLLVLISGIIGVITAVWFFRHERRTDEPMLDLDYLLSPGIIWPWAAIAVGFCTTVGSGFLYIMYLQLLQGRSALNSALVSMMFIVGWITAAPLAPKFVEKYGSRIIITIGLVIYGFTYIMFIGLLGDNQGIWWMVIIYVIQGIGLGFAVTSATDMVMANTPPDRYGVGSSLNDMARQLTGAIGVAFLGSIAAGVFTYMMTTGGYDIADLSEGIASNSSDIVSESRTVFLYALMAVGAASAAISLLIAACVWFWCPSHTDLDFIENE